MRRNITGCHEGGGGNILIIIEERQSAPDGDKEKRQQKKNQPWVERIRKIDLNVFSFQDDPCNQAACQSQHGCQPECNRGRHHLSQNIGKPGFSDEADSQTNHRNFTAAQAEQAGGKQTAANNPQQSP